MSNMNWIKVEDELPEIDKRVIVYFKHLLDDLDFAYIDEDGDWISYSESYRIKQPDYWCELTVPNDKGDL